MSIFQMLVLKYGFWTACFITIFMTIVSVALHLISFIAWAALLQILFGALPHD